MPVAQSGRRGPGKCGGGTVAARSAGWVGGTAVAARSAQWVGENGSSSTISTEGGGGGMRSVWWGNGGSCAIHTAVAREGGSGRAIRAVGGEFCASPTADPGGRSIFEASGTHIHGRGAILWCASGPIWAPEAWKMLLPPGSRAAEHFCFAPRPIWAAEAFPKPLELASMAAR